VESQKFSRSQLESSIYPYLVTLPSYYLKFLKLLFDKLRLEVNYKAFENLSSLTGHGQQMRLENARAIDKKNLPKLFQTNLELHKSNRADCCAIYSSNYELHSKLSSSFASHYDQTQLYFNDLLQELLDMKASLGIEDYITSTQVGSNPMIKEIEKYSAIKRLGEDEFNENITFGNPYKKKRKAAEGENKDAADGKRKDSASSADSKLSQ
jgi:hypothetical protein